MGTRVLFTYSWFMSLIVLRNKIKYAIKIVFFVEDSNVYEQLLLYCSRPFFQSTGKNDNEPFLHFTFSFYSQRCIISCWYPGWSGYRILSESPGSFFGITVDNARWVGLWWMKLPSLSQTFKYIHTLTIAQLYQAWFFPT